MRCRFLYFISQLGRGGSERQLYYLLKHMDRRRYKPAVVVWDYNEEDIASPEFQALCVPIYPLPKAASSFARIKALRRMVKHLRPEVIHCFTYYLNFAAWWAALGTPTTALGAMRSDVTQTEKDGGWWLSRINTRWPRRQIFNSYAAAKSVRRLRSFFVPEQLFVITNRVDLNRFSYTPSAPGGQVCIAGLGSLRAVKRWDRLLLAAAALRSSGLDFTIKIIGGGPLHGALLQQAQALKIASRVEFLGDRDDVPDLLANATFVVHPSDSEGSPNAVLEAMACGRAVVATNVGDIPYLLDNGKSGFVVACGDDAMLVDRILQLLTDRDLCRRMGAEGRRKAEKAFGLDSLVADTLAVYRSAGWSEAAYLPDPVYQREPINAGER